MAAPHRLIDTDGADRAICYRRLCMLGAPDQDISMAFRRILALLFVAALALVPSLTRARQALDTRPAASFRDVEVRPDPDVLPAELPPCSPLEVSAVLQPLDEFVDALTRPLPTPPVRSDGDALRAPPAAVLA
jgi:hypothetical protein